MQHYLYLIQELLRCPKNSQPEILEKNSALVDAQLLKLIEDMMAKYSQTQAPSIVSSLSTLSELIKSQLESPSTDNNSELPGSPNRASSKLAFDDADEAEFFSSFLPLILQSNGDFKSILPAMLKTMDPEVSGMFQSAFIASGGNPEKFISSIVQSGALGAEDGGIAEMMKGLAKNVSDGRPPKSKEENMVSMIKGMLDLAEQQGKSKEAAPIKEQLQTLTELLGVDSPYGNKPKSLVVNSQTELLLMALSTIAQNKEYGQLHTNLFPLLEANVDKLDDSFSKVIRDWGKALPKGNYKNSETMAGGIFLFGEVIESLQRGEPKTNVEIAIACYETSLVSFDKRRNPLFWSIAQASLGKAFLSRISENRAEDIEKSIEKSQLALQTYPLPEARKEWIGTQINLSNSYRERIQGSQTNNIELAIAAAQAALEHSDKTNLTKAWATSQQTLAAAYSDRISGDPRMNTEIAIDAYNKALTFYTRKSNPKRWAGIKNNLTHAYRDRAYGNRAQNLEMAITAAKEALSVQTVDTPMDRATIQTTLGSTYAARIEGDRIDNLDLAIAAYRSALEVYTIDSTPEMWALTQANLAVIYFTRAEQSRPHREKHLNLAIAACHAALRIYTRQDFPKRWISTSTTLANAYNLRIGESRTQNIEQAITLYEEALEIGTKERFPESWALIQLNLANAQKGLNLTSNLRSAVSACQKALEVYTQSSHPSLWAMTQNNLGLIYLSLGETSAAIQSFREALKVHTPETDPLNCRKHGANLGRTALRSGQWQTAIEGFEIAISAIEKSRGWATFDTRKQEIISEAIDSYFGIVEACIKNNQLREALEYVERSKAQNLVELLSDRDYTPKGNVPAQTIHRLKQLTRDIVSELRRLEVSEGSSMLTMTTVDNRQLPSEPNISKRDYLSQLQQQLEKLITEEIDPIDPTFRSTQQVQAISFAEIRSLTDKKTTILEWYVTSTGFYTFAINAQWDSPKVWLSENFDHDNFRKLIAAFNDYLKTYQNDRDRWKDSLPEKLLNLAQILCIEDILNELPAECDRLILVTHRFLHLLPLHALPIQNGDTDTPSYLLDRFPAGISYAPSSQFLHMSQASERPDFDRLIALQNPKTQLEDLPYTNLSTRTLETLFDSEKTQIFESTEATRDNLYTASLSSCHCLHFGCHGYFNTRNTRESALMLANTSKLEEKAAEKFIKIDETHAVNIGHCLTLDDIFNLNLSQCRLVMLSACETGLIEFQNASDEYVGLPSGFMYAGSTNVVSSLWRVNEVSTLLLVTKFYLELQNQQPIRVALNQAQQWLRDSTGEEIMQWIETQKIPIDDALLSRLQRRVHQIQYPFRSPYHWGAFCGAGQ